MEYKLHELLQQDVIKESISSWSSTCLLVTKHDNQDYRIVTDFRILNSKTTLMAKLLPNIQESTETIGVSKPKWFSRINIQSAFFQAALHRDSRQFIAFLMHMDFFNRLAFRKAYLI